MKTIIGTHFIFIYYTVKGIICLPYAFLKGAAIAIGSASGSAIRPAEAQGQYCWGATRRTKAAKAAKASP